MSHTLNNFSRRLMLQATGAAVAAPDRKSVV